MNRLDREIMKALLIEKQNIYEIMKVVNENYPTVRRHILRMQSDRLLDTTKEDSGRKEITSTLTLRGLATLLIEGDLKEKELKDIVEKISQSIFKKKPKHTAESEFMNEVFSNTVLKLRPKVNLKYFDEDWFKEIYRISILEASKNAVMKYKEKFEQEGIWSTDKEKEKEPYDFFERLMNGEDFDIFERE